MSQRVNRVTVTDIDIDLSWVKGIPYKCSVFSVRRCAVCGGKARNTPLLSLNQPMSQFIRTQFEASVLYRP